MGKCNFTTYEGSKPYIFISYAHKDSAVVYPILETLNSKGYRVWYDDGISPGSEWPEYIARHIDNCDTVLFFASPNSVASENCRRELNFTMSRNKKFLTIITEPTDFSLGMELQLSSHQSVMKYEHASDEDFYNKLFSTNIFNNCLKEEGEDNVDEVSKDTVKVEAPQNNSDDISEVVVSNDAADNNSETVVSTAAADNIVEETVSSKEATPIVEESIEKKPVVTNNVSTSNETSSDNVTNDTNPKKKSKKAPVIIGSSIAIILAVVLVLIVGISVALGLIIHANKPITFSDGQTASRNDTSLYFYNDHITAKDIKEMGKLKNITSLSFTECQFDVDADLNGLKNLENVTSFTLENCSNITDFQFISNMTSLLSLRVTNNPNFNDLSYVASLPLNSLIIDDTGVTDLSPLNDKTSLHNLSCNNCAISTTFNNTTPAYMYSLEMSGCGLTDISFINSFSNVYELDLSNNMISDLTVFDYCNSINQLNLSHNDISDISPLSHFTEITELDLSYNSISDPTPISYFYSLEKLNLSNNDFKQQDIEFISLFSNLTDLRLNNIPLDSLSFILNNNSITSLYLSGCNLDNDALNIPIVIDNYEVIDISNNNLTSLSPWQTTHENDLFSEAIIDISHNKLSSLDFLDGLKYETLIAYDNPIDYNSFDPVTTFTDAEVKYLVLDYNEKLLSCGDIDTLLYLFVSNYTTDSSEIYYKFIIKYSNDDFDVFKNENSNVLYWIH